MKITIFFSSGVIAVCLLMSATAESRLIDEIYRDPNPSRPTWAHRTTGRLGNGEQAYPSIVILDGILERALTDGTRYTTYYDNRSSKRGYTSIGLTPANLNYVATELLARELCANPTLNLQNTISRIAGMVSKVDEREKQDIEHDMRAYFDGLGVQNYIRATKEQLDRQRSAVAVLPVPTPARAPTSLYSGQSHYTQQNALPASYQSLGGAASGSPASAPTPLPSLAIPSYFSPPAPLQAQVYPNVTPPMPVSSLPIIGSYVGMAPSVSSLAPIASITEQKSPNFSVTVMGAPMSNSTLATTLLPEFFGQYVVRDSNTRAVRFSGKPAPFSDHLPLKDREILSYNIWAPGSMSGFGGPYRALDDNPRMENVMINSGLYILRDPNGGKIVLMQEVRSELLMSQSAPTRLALQLQGIKIEFDVSGIKGPERFCNMVLFNGSQYQKLDDSIKIKIQGDIRKRIFDHKEQYISEQTDGRANDRFQVVCLKDKATGKNYIIVNCHLKYVHGLRGQPIFKELIQTMVNAVTDGVRGMPELRGQNVEVIIGGDMNNNPEVLHAPGTTLAIPGGWQGNLVYMPKSSISWDGGSGSSRPESNDMILRLTRL